MMLQKYLLIIVVTLMSFMLVGCWEDSLLDRSLIFSTHTTLGIEVAVSPAETTSPAKIIIGYKRTEGVINPVYHSKGIKTSKIEKTTKEGGKTTIETTPCGTSRYKKEAYSVIAKFSGETSAKAERAAEGKLSVAQWFATGEAAKTLARQPGIAGAVSGSSEVAKAAAQEAGVRKLMGDASLGAEIVMTHIYNGLKALADEGDTQASTHVAALDVLGTLAPDEFTGYKRTAPPEPAVTFEKFTKNDTLDNGKVTFNTYLEYKGILHTSINTLRENLKQPAFEYDPTGTAKRTATDEDRANLEKDLNLFKSLRDNLYREFARNKGVIAAICYYCDVLIN
jgi:hypothetical protein